MNIDELLNRFNNMSNVESFKFWRQSGKSNYKLQILKALIERTFERNKDKQERLNQ